MCYNKIKFEKTFQNQLHFARYIVKAFKLAEGRDVMRKNTAPPREPASDAHIVHLYWTRNTRAILETDRKYGKLLYRVAYDLLHDHGDSEECQNDTYLDVWKAIPPTRPRVFGAFIAKIARRISIDLYRHKAKKRSVPSELTSSLDELEFCLSDKGNVLESIEVKELARLLNTFLKTLSQKQQYIFISRFYFSYSVEYIAREMGDTPSSVYKSLEKIKRTLGGYLKRKGVDL